MSKRRPSRFFVFNLTSSGIIHIAGFVGILATLAAMAKKTTSQVVFLDFVNSSGWGSDGISWLVGLVSAVYPFLG